jgi:hypothetical protein
VTKLAKTDRQTAATNHNASFTMFPVRVRTKGSAGEGGESRADRPVAKNACRSQASKRRTEESSTLGTERRQRSRGAARVRGSEAVR